MALKIIQSRQLCCELINDKTTYDFLLVICSKYLRTISRIITSCLVYNLVTTVKVTAHL